MTPQQRTTLDFIADHLAEKGCSPSLEEIATHLGLKAKSGAHRIVHQLIDRGYVRRENGTQRALVPVEIGGPRLDKIPTAELRAELARRGEAVAASGAGQ